MVKVILLTNKIELSNVNYKIFNNLLNNFKTIILTIYWTINNLLNNLFSSSKTRATTEKPLLAISVRRLW